LVFYLLLFAGGLIALVIGADALVRGASKLAIALGISPLVVGLTIVAFGTSAPEMAVSTGAVFSGTTDLAIGNVVGSNTFNVLFILGLAALITPLAVHIQVVRQEAPIMVGGAALLLLLVQDGQLGLFDGLLLLGLLLAYTVFLIRQSRAETRSEATRAGADGAGGENDWDAEFKPGPTPRWDDRLAVQVLLILVGLGLLVGGSHAMVTAAVVFAQALGVSEVVIGLTIVAAGTSLPEVAASVAAALKGERDIAVGNVVGSCVFNIFGVVGLAALAAVFAGISALPVPDSVRQVDLWVMMAALVACLPVFITGREIARWEGGLFLGFYAAYTAYLVMVAQQHAALGVFTGAMMGWVLPLTLVLLMFSFVRKPL
jgi:cation:H+ antiporter